MVYLVTGGAGFVGARVVRRLLERGEVDRVVVLDLLTYAGDLGRLEESRDDPRLRFVHGDVADRTLLEALFREHRPARVVHLAAETHVDRSVDDAEAFVRTNVVGTWALLETARRFVAEDPGRAPGFRFVNVSTDEVYGSVPPDCAVDERARLSPSSPYAASKAGADHLVEAYRITHGLPVVHTFGANTYGPFQYPEKLVPLATLRALAGLDVPLYGDGAHERDWVHVDDHADAILAVADRAAPGTRWNVSGGAPRRNREVVEAVCDALDRLRPPSEDASLRVRGITRRADLIRLAADRPGHDRRYAADSARLRAELSWRPRVPFDEGLAGTVRWYFDHQGWCARVTEGRYDLGRLGLPPTVRGTGPVD